VLNVIVCHNPEYKPNIKPINAWKIRHPAFNSPDVTVNEADFFSNEKTRSHANKASAVLGNANDINHAIYP